MSRRSNSTRTRAMGGAWVRDGTWAVVTGATSGIGAEFAGRLASMGLNLIITGRREELLRTRADQLKDRHGITVRTVTGDLRDRDAIENLESMCAGVEVAVLVNNAGYSSHGEFADLSANDVLSLNRVLAEVPLRTMTVVLPQMKKRRGGLVINVGSLAGRLAVPGASVYVASKAFVERLSETVALEVASSRVVVQALLPGYMKTDFHRDISNYQEKQRSRGFIRWTNADKVVDFSLRAAERAQRRVEKGKRPRPRDIVVVPGFVNRLLLFLSRFAPRRVIHHAAVNRKRI